MKLRLFPFAAVQSAVLVGLALTSLSVFGDEKIRKTTAAYKRVGDLEIKANVYRIDDDAIRPVVVWIHGGALINGHRDGISGRVRNWAAERGHALVSIDYRLAPRCCDGRLGRRIHDAYVRLSRVATSAGSAGPVGLR